MVHESASFYTGCFTATDATVHDGCAEIFSTLNRPIIMVYLLSALIGIASWYGPELEGRPTASGEPFNPKALTAASWHYPFDTLLEVTNVSTGESVVVRINDRGPARRLGRLIDLSQASFARIADLDQGLVQVEIQQVSKTKAANSSE